MKTEEIIIANLKCNGCASTIKKELSSLIGVKEVTVDVEKDAVNVTYETIGRESIINKLHSLGYPEATEKKRFVITNQKLRKLHGRSNQ